MLMWGFIDCSTETTECSQIHDVAGPSIYFARTQYSEGNVFYSNTLSFIPRHNRLCLSHNSITSVWITFHSMTQKFILNYTLKKNLFSKVSIILFTLILNSKIHRTKRKTHIYSNPLFVYILKSFTLVRRKSLFAY
jgi:hypothetical protein